MELPPLFLNNDNSCVEITDDLWDKILFLYLKMYRGPTADQDLKRELQDYKVLRKDAKIAPGSYVRYMSRGVIASDLKRGGYVVKCSLKTITLQSGKRLWHVSRLENYIFVHKNEGKIPNHRKSIMRMLAEDAIRKDDNIKTSKKENENERVKLKANFL